MKKWLYVLSVGGMTAIFIALYIPAKHLAEAREAARQASIAHAKEEAEAHQRDIEAKAKADADRRAAERIKEEADKAAEEQRRWESEIGGINSSIASAKADIQKYDAQIAELTAELDSLNQHKDEANREDFDLAKAVELARVDQFTAEMEIQRMVEMIASRADQASFANPPPPPPPKD